jgi:hypothetical protein
MASNAWTSLPLALVLASCGSVPDAAVPADAGLEAAALARGLVRESGDAPPSGLFARDGDRVCLVAAGGAVRLGVVSRYADGTGCAATGVAQSNAGTLDVTLGARGDCAFAARYDGQRIVFPARMPAGCERFCSPRASLSALSVERLSDSGAEAQALRDRDGRAPCAG